MLPIRLFLGLLDPNPLVRVTDSAPDPSIIKKSKKNLNSYYFVTSLWLFYLWQTDVNVTSKSTVISKNTFNVTDPQHCWARQTRSSFSSSVSSFNPKGWHIQNSRSVVVARKKRYTTAKSFLFIVSLPGESISPAKDPRQWADPRAGAVYPPVAPSSSSASQSPQRAGSALAQWSAAPTAPADRWRPPHRAAPAVRSNIGHWQRPHQCVPHP